MKKYKNTSNLLFGVYILVAIAVYTGVVDSGGWIAKTYISLFYTILVGFFFLKLPSLYDNFAKPYNIGFYLRFTPIYAIFIFGVAIIGGLYDISAGIVLALDTAATFIYFLFAVLASESQEEADNITAGFSDAVAKYKALVLHLMTDHWLGC